MGNRIAYEYGRYSSGMQGKGHSEERQTGGAVAWCKRHGVELDTSTVYMDRGTSAFRGKHRKAGSPLRAFLDEVEAGRIARGSVLIIENLDRLSRENPWDAVPLLCQIVNAGLDVVTLSPAEVVYTRSGDLTGLILAVVEFGRGHSESKTKSDRIAAVWDKRKRLAREGAGIITRRLPSWVRVGKNGKLELIPERVGLIERIFALAIAGYGNFEIVRTLTREGVKPWGRGKSWTKAFVRKILTGRAVLGEHQPLKNRQPDGPPIVGYYPPVIDLPTWERAQLAVGNRREPPGRVGAKVTNLFSGLLTDALTGERLLIAWQTQGSGGKRRKQRALVAGSMMDGGRPSVTLPYAVFEEAILALLKEITPADVTGAEAPPESTALAVEAAALEARLKDVEAELLAGDDVPTLARVARQLDAKLQDVLRRLAAARQQEANPASAALASARTLMDAAADEPGRLRLRSLLGQLVEGVRVLIVPRRSMKLCAVQIDFRQGLRRSLLIVYKPARRGVQGGWSVCSFAGVPGAEDLDLREPDHVRELETALLRLDLADRS